MPLASIDLRTKGAPRARRSSAAITCVVPAGGVVGEAVVALVLADALLEKFGGDSLLELQDHLETTRARWRDFRRAGSRVLENLSSTNPLVPRKHRTSPKGGRRGLSVQNDRGAKRADSFQHLLAGATSERAGIPSLLCLFARLCDELTAPWPTRTIVKFGHPMLHEPSAPVNDIDG